MNSIILVFDNWNETENRIADFVISNNHDAERVLAPVAATVIDFCSFYPDALIYAEGSTLESMTLQMGIYKYLQEIDPIFEVISR